MIKNFIDTVSKIEVETLKSLIDKISSNMDKELSEQLSEKQKKGLMSNYNIDSNSIHLITDITKYIFNNAASDKKFDKGRKLLSVNKMKDEIIDIFEEVIFKFFL